MIGDVDLLPLVSQGFVKALGDLVGRGGVQRQPLGAFAREVVGDVVHQVSRVPLLPRGLGDVEIREVVIGPHGQRACGRIELREADGLAVPVEQQKDLRAFFLEVGLDEGTRGREVVFLFVEDPVVVEQACQNVELFQGALDDLHVDSVGG